MDIVYQNLIHESTSKASPRPTGETIGYAHPGDPTLEGVILPHGQIEQRIIMADAQTPLLITTLRCGCDFEIAVMTPMDTTGEGGQR